jgi:hypothetical protein
VLLARRNLLKDTMRLALSVTGVALAVMLILLLQGFLDGMYRQIAAYLEYTPARSWRRKMCPISSVQLRCCRRAPRLRHVVAVRR